MKILQPRFIIYFLVILILCPAIAYLTGLDRNLNYLFFAKAFAVAFFVTVMYYLMVQRAEAKAKGR